MSIERKSILEVAETLGVKLLPWQVEAAQAIESNETFAISRANRGGVNFFRNVVNRWREQNCEFFRAKGMHLFVPSKFGPVCCGCGTPALPEEGAAG